MERLHSDGASNVDGYLIHELCSLLGVGKSKSSRLHPQGDGLAESMVKVLKSCIQKQVDQHGNNWDLQTQSAVYAMRTSVNKTGFAPAQMLFGSNIKLPIDLLAATHAEDIQASPKNYNQKQAQQYISQLGNEIKRTFQEARLSLTRERLKMKKHYDKRSTAHDFLVNDCVMLWYPYKKAGLSKVWQPNWNGPFYIHNLVGDCNCHLRDQFGRISTKVIHVNQLKHVGAPMNNTSRPNNQPHICSHEQLRPTIDILDYASDDAEDTVNPVQGQPLIAEQWCNINSDNILPGRTRSDK